MKAANKDHMGDDAYFDRLFSYLKSQFPDLVYLRSIHGHVFRIKTTKNTYILKGYQSNKRLKLMEAFTATLRKEGFLKTYQFLPPPAKEDLQFEGIYFGCIEYLPPTKPAFSFDTKKSRGDGLELLEQFHRTTGVFAARYRTLLAPADLLGKWKERLHIFTINLPVVRYFINESVISEMIGWAQWSLTKLETTPAPFKNEPPVILHGDVAHHNFLRSKLGELYLIDFDLISIGPPAFDYIQYSNRILPFIDWTFEKLADYPQLNKYLQDKAFISALAYPADIFREWNRLIREKSYTDQEKLKQVIDLSLSQYHNRKKFFEKITGQLD